MPPPPPDLQKMWTAQPALRHLFRCGCFLPLHFHLSHTPLPPSPHSLPIPYCFRCPQGIAFVLCLCTRRFFILGFTPSSPGNRPPLPPDSASPLPGHFCSHPLPAVHPSFFMLPELRQHQAFFDSSFGFHLALCFSLFLPLPPPLFRLLPVSSLVFLSAHFQPPLPTLSLWAISSC